MRNNFSEKTKKALAGRVGWCCSFPGCNISTIGPQHGNSTEAMILGEAAHIFAASKGGPRYNPNMTDEEASSIENGIWLCRQHARLSRWNADSSSSFID